MRNRQQFVKDVNQIKKVIENSRRTKYQLQTSLKNNLQKRETSKKRF